MGVSRVDGKLAGDVHPDVWEVAGHVSPNPGGVGPLTRAFLLTNVVELAERSHDRGGVRPQGVARPVADPAWWALIFLAAFGLVAAGYWRRGALVIGIGVGVAAVLRLALPDDRAGLLVVRSKGIDFVTTATVARRCSTSPGPSTRWAPASSFCPPGKLARRAIFSIVAV